MVTGLNFGPRSDSVGPPNWRVCSAADTALVSIFACCHSVKRCALAAQSFRSRQNGAVTRI